MLRKAHAAGWALCTLKALKQGSGTPEHNGNPANLSPKKQYLRDLLIINPFGKQDATTEENYDQMLRS